MTTVFKLTRQPPADRSSRHSRGLLNSSQTVSGMRELSHRSARSKSSIYRLLYRTSGFQIGLRSIGAVAATMVLLLQPSPINAQPSQKEDRKIATDASQEHSDASVKMDEVEELADLPRQHRPKLTLKIQPKKGIVTGDLIHLQIVADATKGDDVTLPEQEFGVFEVHKKSVKIGPEPDSDRVLFTFTIDLLALEPGKHKIPKIAIRVVTKDGIIGRIETDPVPVTVTSLLANEPDAKLKEPTQPVTVMEDDYTILYIIGSLAAALVIALLTLFLARWWRRRIGKEPPPPPPRPAWEIAIEKLQKLEREKKEMIEQDKGQEFVDQVSDVVREYLGGRFAGGYLAFTGLETTSSEMIQILRELRVKSSLLEEITAFLFRCDLIKFAKVVPNQDEMDLILAEAQEIVRSSTPQETPEESNPSSSSPRENNSGIRSS